MDSILLTGSNLQPRTYVLPVAKKAKTTAPQSGSINRITEVIHWKDIETSFQITQFTTRVYYIIDCDSTILWDIVSVRTTTYEHSGYIFWNVDVTSNQKMGVSTHSHWRVQSVKDEARLGFTHIGPEVESGGLNRDEGPPANI